MNLIEILNRLATMEKNARHNLGPCVGENNAEAFRLAREIIENAATNALLPPPQQVVHIKVASTPDMPYLGRPAAFFAGLDLSKAESFEARLERAAREMVDFCYPRGNWRGYAHFKGVIKFACKLQEALTAIDEAGANKTFPMNMGETQRDPDFDRC